MRIVVAGICLGTALLAGAASMNHSVKELMGDLGDTMLRMLPAAYSEAPDRTLLLENLVRLEYLLDQAAPHFEEPSDGARVTLELLQARLGEAREFGTRGNLAMLQSTIGDSFALCATCHVQDRISRNAFDRGQTQNLDPYLAAEYRFLTRDYNTALSTSLKYFEQQKRSSRQDSIVLQRILTVGVEVRRDLAFTIEQLSEVRHRLHPDHYNYARVGDWISVLKRLQTENRQLQSPIGSTLKSLDRFLSLEWPEIRTLLNFSQQEAYWVAIRGELNRHLNSDAGKRNLPQIYYWLAVADRELQYRFHGSLSRAYLETCVTEYPGDPYASRCLDEYEFLVLISFSGSSGTHVPPEVNERLNELRKLVVSNQP